MFATAPRLEIFSNCCGQTLCDQTLDADGTRGGIDVLKHCSKNSFNMLALQALLVPVIPLFRVRHETLEDERYAVIKAYKFTVSEILRSFFVLSYIAFTESIIIQDC